MCVKYNNRIKYRGTSVLQNVLRSLVIRPVCGGSLSLGTFPSQLSVVSDVIPWSDDP